MEVPGPATTDTYRYSQDGRLDRGPSVLPAVYDQDEPDASVLQAETRGHGQHAPGGLAMAAARLREELGVNPIFPSGCEGTLGVALESLQGLRDLT